MLKENQMLRSITKLFTGEKESEEMKKDEAQASETSLTITGQVVADLTAGMEKLQADFEAFKTEANALIAQADAEKAELKKQVETLVVEKAAMIADAAAKKLATRKAKVEAAIGENERAAKLLTATEQMEDAAFEAIVAALETSIDAEAKSQMFTEAGVAASADVTKVAEGSGTKKLQALIEAELGITAQ
jgi:hypothetical protein